MKTTTRVRQFWRVGAVIASLVMAASVHAQSGTISGRVLNETTGEYLHAAIVRIPDTSYRTSTDLTGSYTLRGVPTGNYTVEVSYLGLGTQRQTTEVRPGGVSRVNFNIREDLVELEGVEVEVLLIGTEAAVNQQRAARGVQNIVSNEQFGQLNDGNIAQALRIMPGLSVDTDGSTETHRYVNIRGFDASLNVVALDGNRLASSETGAPNQRGRGTAYSGAARAFALDDIPAAAISTVEIVKSPTPDMDGDALGGTVNLVTKSAFERVGRSVQFQIAGDYSELRENWGPSLSVTYSDVYDVGSGQNNLGVSFTVSYFDQDEGFDNIDRDWIYLSPTDDGLDLSGIRPYETVDYLKSQIDEDKERTGQPVIGYNEDTEYNNYNIGRERYAFSASFDYRLSDRTELYFKPTFTHETRDQDDFRHHIIMDSSDVAGLHHGDRADPLEQYVSPYLGSDSNYNAGNYFEFLAAAEALGVEDQEFAPGDALTLAGGESGEGATLIFDPGNLVRLGNVPDRIATISPNTTDIAGGTTYNPDGTGRGQARYEGTWEVNEIDFYNFNLGGRTELDWGEVTYNAYYSNNTKEFIEFQQEWQRRGFQFAYDRTGDIYSFEHVTVNEWNGQGDYANREDKLRVSRFEIPNQSDIDRFRDSDLERKVYETNEDILGAQLDVEIDFSSDLPFTGSFKTGVKVRTMSRDYDYDEKEWDLSSSFPFAEYLFFNTFDAPYGKDYLAIPYVPDAQRIYSEALPANPEWFSEQYTDNLRDSITNDYEAEEDVYAGYLMGTVEVGDLTLIGGFRYEHTEFTSRGFLFDRNTRDAPAGLDAYTFDESSLVEGTYEEGQNYNAFLPSVHLRYNITDNLVGRISWGKTYARPGIKDMVGQVFITEDGNEVSIFEPNINLPPQRSENYDLSLEYYTNDGGFLQIAYFYKDMTNYAFSEVVEESSYPGYPSSDWIVTIERPVANTDAVNQGLELAINQPLSFLPIEGFAFTGSATFTKSEADYYTGRTGPVVGHSHRVYNFALEYDNHGLYARLSYIYRSQFFENISITDFAEESEAIPADLQYIYDDTFMNPAIWNLETGYEFMDGYTFFINVTNLTEAINASRQGFYQYPEDNYPNQRRWTIGLRGSL